MSSIGVLIPSMHLKGGGERHGLTTAAALSASHEVSVYSRTPADRGELAAWFGLDLSRVRFVTLPGFPLVGRALLRFNLLPGVAGWLRDQRVWWWLRARRHDYFVNVAHYSLMPNPAPRGMFLCMFPRELTRAERSTGVLRRLGARLGLGVGLASLRTYPTWAANSDYTVGWIRRWWGEGHIEHLYPPCEDMSVAGSVRGKSIVNVGRFFPHDNPAENNKRQDVLIEAFSRLTDLHDQGWTLHLAGSLSEAANHRAYYDSLVDAAAGLPVIFHPNAPLDEVRRLYSEASLYWHATGFGTDQELYPAAQEHFGITPVEAMSAGAVPMVYASAGPLSNVDDGVTGTLWRSVDDLVGQTRRLVSDEAALAAMSDAARTYSARFDRSSFYQNAQRIVHSDLRP